MDTGSMKACGVVAACAVALSPVSALAKGTLDDPTVVSISPAGNDVDVSGMVGVSGEVEIKNDSGSAVAVDTMRAARTPFAYKYEDSTFTFGVDFSIPVPEGRRLVIEHISGLLVNQDPDFLEEVEILTTTNDQELKEFPTLHETPASGDGVYGYAFSEELRLYADAGTNVKYDANYGSQVVDSSPGLVTTVVSISGYTVPMDEPSLAP